MKPHLRNVGEACFFRAYSYFELVKAYGEVPLINFYYTNAAEGVRPKSPVDAIYALIDSDLNVASQYLPLNWEVGGYQFVSRSFNKRRCKNFVGSNLFIQAKLGTSC